MNGPPIYFEQPAICTVFAHDKNSSLLLLTYHRSYILRFVKGIAAGQKYNCHNYIAGMEVASRSAASFYMGLWQTSEVVAACKERNIVKVMPAADIVQL